MHQMDGMEGMEATFAWNPDKQVIAVQWMRSTWQFCNVFASSKCLDHLDLKGAWDQAIKNHEPGGTLRSWRNSALIIGALSGPMAMVSTIFRSCPLGMSMAERVRLSWEHRKGKSHWPSTWWDFWWLFRSFIIFHSKSDASIYLVL